MLKFISILLCFFSLTAEATPNFHLLGWVNAVVPGGGQYMLGNYGLGALQTGLEVGTFYAGFSNSALSPMTLDGVPEDLPTQTTNFSKVNVKQRNCTYNASLKKTVCTTTTVSTTTGSASTGAVDLSRSLYADWLQEFGLKYHMVNVYNAYREAAGPNASIGTQAIDQTSTADLFLAPFKWDNLSDSWVWPALVVSAGALIYNYNQAVRNGQLTAIAPLNKGSQRQYDFTYLAVFPSGSGAPEEMFYRGFLQYEMYNMVESPFFSIGMSTLAYTFSHSADDRPSAAITGAYLGWLAHHNHGSLSKSIAFHFWSDILAGIYQITIVRKESGKVPLFDLNLTF
jgi:hypothetical protein